MMAKKRTAAAAVAVQKPSPPDSLNEKQRAFLAAYIAHEGNISEAAIAAGVHRANHSRWLSQSEDYKAAFRDTRSQLCDMLEAEIYRRAVHGERELVLSDGKPVFVWVDSDGEVVPARTKGAKRVPLYKTKKSDTLLIFRAKKEMPQYRDSVKSNVSGALAIQTNTHIEVNNAAQLIANDPGYLEYLRTRAIDCDSSSVRESGQPRALENGEAPGPDRPSGNGHHHGQNGTSSDH